MLYGHLFATAIFSSPDFWSIYSNFLIVYLPITATSLQWSCLPVPALIHSIKSTFCKGFPKLIRTIPIIFRKVLKLSEDNRRLLNTSEQSSKMHKVRSTIKTHMISLISSHVKISCFHGERNPCNLSKFIQ